MINVHQISIDLELPTSQISVVAMQPYLDLQQIEPFKQDPNSIEDLLTRIRKTLDLAQDCFDGRSAYFTIFPEYSIPGLQGINMIDNQISENWSNGAVIIAGIHGLNKNEFQEICNQIEVMVSDDNSPNIIPDDKWVNACLIWVKGQDGTVRRFFQLKIRPSWPERNVLCNDMFQGSTAYVFNYTYSNNVPSSFTTLICFDWVANIDGCTTGDELLSSLNQQSNPNTHHLDFVFVIQHNDSPNHSSFLDNTSRFLNNPGQYAFVDRANAVIYHINTAASLRPIKEGKGAFSACIFAPRTPLSMNGCRPTFSMQPEILRKSNILKENQCKDVVFREMGQCGHRFKLPVSRFVASGPTNRTHPILDAEVHSLLDESDPRLSGKAIPAVIKWLNDSLDNIKSLAQTSLNSCSLYDEAETINGTIISNMRLIEDGEMIKNRIDWARIYNGTDNVSSRYQNPDLWDNPDPEERQALEHIIYTLTSLGLAYKISVQDSSYHGTISDESIIELIAIRGETFQDCCKHHKNHVPKSKNDPVLVIVRDRDNNHATKQEFQKFYESDSEKDLKYLDYQTLIDLSRRAANSQILKEELNEYLPGVRRII